jgi:hypothetical protein
MLCVHFLTCLYSERFYFGLLIIYFPYISTFSLLSLFWKNESSLMRSPCCLCVCVPPPNNFWMPYPIFIKLGKHIMAPEPISMAYFLNPSHQSVCLSVCVSLLSLPGKGSVKYIPPFVTRQRLSKHVPVATNTLNNRINVGHVCLYSSAVTR